MKEKSTFLDAIDVIGYLIKYENIWGGVFFTITI
nr:hypothetical protein [Borreliella mayonii]